MKKINRSGVRCVVERGTTNEMDGQCKETVKCERGCLWRKEDCLCMIVEWKAFVNA